MIQRYPRFIYANDRTENRPLSFVKFMPNPVHYLRVVDVSTGSVVCDIPIVTPADIQWAFATRNERAF